MAHENEIWRDSPVVWFSLLEKARARDDIEGAKTALRELHRLGVNVTHEPARAGGES